MILCKDIEKFLRLLKIALNLQKRINIKIWNLKILYNR